MMTGTTRDPLPDDVQRRRLCELLADALVDIRTAEAGRANALAYALHILPRTMWGWGTWSIKDQRGRLAYYQAKHPGGPDYVAMFDAIFAHREG
jgi:hypothetical protein